MVQTVVSSYPRSAAYSPSILSCKKENQSIDVARRISELSSQPGRTFKPWGQSSCCPLQNSSFRLLSPSHNASLHALSGGVLNSYPSIKFSFSSSSLFSSLAFGMANTTPSKRIGGQSRGECLGLRRNSLATEDKVTTGEATPLKEGGGKGGSNGGDGGGGGGGGGGDAINWISSALVLAFWAGLLFYGVTMSPNQTQYRDVYFVEKLLNLHSDDGFIMNKVLIAEFYIMGVWPVVYSSLLIPSGRSRKGGPKVGPFAVVSFAVGAFALLPYFGLWRPPAPAVSKDELRQFPLNILESKITAVATVVAGIGLAALAGLAGVDQWAEFLQYFKESRFIHVMSIDFLTLCALAPFWVFNDLSVRQGSESVSWLVALSAIPYFGPAIYLCLRPPLPAASLTKSED